MARNVFVSFRFSDGEEYKNELCKKFSEEDVIDYSEDEDRSELSEDSIREYLYSKLKRTSITIVILTPAAVNYEKDIWGKYDDWLYDELRYSLEDRNENRTNGVIAFYTEEAKDMLFTEGTHKCDTCKKESTVKIMKDFDNLVRENMMNILPEYKLNQCAGIYDSMHDSYCSLVEFGTFINNMDLYLDNAIEKRDKKEEYKLVKRLEN